MTKIDFLDGHLHFNGAVRTVVVDREVAASEGKTEKKKK